MDDLDRLLALTEGAREPEGREELREGIQRLWHENRQLAACKNSLEAQVMYLAHEPEPAEPWWEKVRYLSGDGGSPPLSLDWEEDDYEDAG